MSFVHVETSNPSTFLLNSENANHVQTFPFLFNRDVKKFPFTFLGFHLNYGKFEPQAFSAILPILFPFFTNSERYLMQRKSGFGGHLFLSAFDSLKLTLNKRE